MKLLAWASRQSHIPHVGDHGSQYQFPILAFKELDHHGARRDMWLHFVSQVPVRRIKPASKTSAEEIFGPPDRDMALYRLANFVSRIRFE